MYLWPASQENFQQTESQLHRMLKVYQTSRNNLVHLPYFTTEKTDSLRDEVTCLKTHNN